MISDTRTLRLVVLLCGLLAVFKSSYGAPNQLRRDSSDLLPNGSATNSRPGTDTSTKNGTTVVSSSTILPKPPVETVCQKVFKNITIVPPREDCMPGIIESVPTCSGACNSYVFYVTDVPYRKSDCSCCQATTYHITRRTVTFQCGSRTESSTFNIAAVNECNCSRCAINTRPQFVPRSS
eukprot:Em0021g381a